MARTPELLVACVMISLASCEDVVHDAGLDANLRVEGAQFHRGAPPAGGPGPLVRSVSVSPLVQPGSSGRTCSGVVDPATTAVALSLEGDPGYWIVPAAPPDVTAPGFPTFAATIAFASALAGGRSRFVTHAVDERGRFGAPFLRPIDVTAPPRPVGRLVIALAWSSQADLDLHVVEPSGIEIWKRNTSSHEPPPPGSPPEPPGTAHPGGVLDLDSNAGCVPDGRRAENVVYEAAPPRGRYQARVDTYSLCGEVNARWTLEVFLDGVRLAGAQGLATDGDARFPHDRGAGVLALEIDVP